MKVQLLAGFGALALAGAASAALTGASVQNTGNQGGTTDTWRVYLNFDNPADALLAVSGNVNASALIFQSLDGDALQNSAPGVDGLVQEDIPFATSAAFDSWLTMGSDTFIGNQTQFSPSFLGGDGVFSAVSGTSFSQADNGGYFDNDPGSPVDGGSVLIAQFTVANFSYQGTVDYTAAGAGADQGTFFVTTAPVPAPGALALLGLAGLAARRRRR